MLQWLDFLLTILWIACKIFVATVNTDPSLFVLDVYGLCQPSCLHGKRAKIASTGAKRLSFWVFDGCCTPTPRQMGVGDVGIFSSP
jgi:hypothetical protein